MPFIASNNPKRRKAVADLDSVIWDIDLHH